MSKASPPVRVEGVTEPYRSFIEHVPQMVSLARMAANRLASSYREFNVGSALFSFYPEFSAAEIFYAGNTKREGQEKVCAEQKILGKAARRAKKMRKEIGLASPVLHHAVGLVVVGTTDVQEIEEVTHVRVPTLWSCETCISDYGVKRSVSDETLLVTTGRRSSEQDNRYQVFTVGQMREMYVAGTAEVDGQQTQFGVTDEQWPQRVARYDELQAAEKVLHAAARRSASQLAQLALVSPLPTY